MNKRWFACVGLLVPAAMVSLVAACTDDEDSGPGLLTTDAGLLDRTVTDRGATGDADDGRDAGDAGTLPRNEAGTPGPTCGDAGGAPQRVLVVQGNASPNELTAFNLETNAIDGRLVYDGGYGLTSSAGLDPWFLDEENDIVTRLDAREPWKAVASWNVRGDDAEDGGQPNANPVAIAQVSCTKAYVIRFNRNKIAVIDPSQQGGGLPTKLIDLSSLKVAADTGPIDMTSAVYVPSRKRVYVVVGNLDFTAYVGFALRCPALKSSIIAIDVETDQIVSLGGTGLGGGIELEGYNAPIGSPLVYDAASDRLLVLESGCNAALDDGGVGDVVRRRVEQVDLATGAVKTLVSLDDKAFPSTLAYVDAEHAAIAFGYEGFLWNPKVNTLGAPILPGIDVVTTNGKGGFVGTRQRFLADGGLPVDLLGFPSGDGDAGILKEGVFTRATGYVGSVEAWPHR